MEDNNIAVTLIIPAHNEENRLLTTLELYYKAFTEAFGREFELLVVCNGCTDATAEVALAYMRRAPCMRVLAIDEAVGKGGAVLEGFRNASGTHVIFADADAATDASSLIYLLSELANYDIVIGSRRIKGSHITQPQTILRRIFGTAFYQSTRLLFGLPFFDTQCGAKALKKNAAVLVADMVSEYRWTFDVDLLLSAQRLGLTVAERPVVWTDISGSRLKIVPTITQVVKSFWRMKLKIANSRGFSPVIPSAILANAAPAVPNSIGERELDQVRTN